MSYKYITNFHLKHDLHDKIEIFLLIPIMRIRHILIYHVPFSILASLL